MSLIYRDIPRPSRALIEAFAAFDVGTVHEAMTEDSLMDPAICPLAPGQKVVGPAITASNRPGDNLAMHIGLHLAQPGDVLVTTTGALPQNAVWGEMACTAAVARKLAGLVTDGAIRDTAAVQELGFPVWGKYRFGRRSAKADPGSVNVPIVCGGVLVNPGDLIIADADGVVVVPLGEAEAVLERARQRKAKEEDMRKALQSGKSTFEALGLDKTLASLGIQIIDGTHPRS